MMHPKGYTWKDTDPSVVEMNIANAYRTWDCCGAWHETDVGCTRDPRFPAKKHQVCFFAPNYKSVILEGL
jgi:hypothetical protein